MLEEEICRKLAEQEAEFKLQTETLLIECQRVRSIAKSVLSANDLNPWDMHVIVLLIEVG